MPHIYARPSCSQALLIALALVWAVAVCASRYNLRGGTEYPTLSMQCPGSLYDADAHELYNDLSPLDAGKEVLFGRYTASRKLVLRNRVQSVFNEAYMAYMNWAFPQDELRPLSFGGKRTVPTLATARPEESIISKYAGMGMTLIDSLSTLALMNQTEFLIAVDRTTEMLKERNGWEHVKSHVSFFETNIRMLGGLLSAHALASSPEIMGNLYFNYTQAAVDVINEYNIDNSTGRAASETSSKVIDGVRAKAGLESVKNKDSIPRYYGQLLVLAEQLGRRLATAFERTPECIPNSSDYKAILHELNVQENARKMGSNSVLLNSSQIAASLSIPSWLAPGSPLLKPPKKKEDGVSNTSLSIEEAIERACALTFNSTLPVNRVLLTERSQAFNPFLDREHTCIAASGTVLLEFGYLSSVLKDPVFFEMADGAIASLRNEAVDDLLGTSFYVTRDSRFLRNTLHVLVACYQDFVSVTNKDQGASLENNPMNVSHRCRKALLERQAFLEMVKKQSGKQTVSNDDKKHSLHNTIEDTVRDSGRKLEWSDSYAGIGAGSDSYHEYLCKSAFFFDNTKYLETFNSNYKSIMKHTHRQPWYTRANMKPPHHKIDVYLADILQAFWPGMQTLIGDFQPAVDTVDAFFRVWMLYGVTPERFISTSSLPKKDMSYYPLRPELIESIYLLYRATKHPKYLAMGEIILRDLIFISRTMTEYSTTNGNSTDPEVHPLNAFQYRRRWHPFPARIGCGRVPPNFISSRDPKSHPQTARADDSIATTGVPYANIKRAEQLALDDSMSSFFLAESLKYLYLLFDENNPIHTSGDGMKWIFTTEAHLLPITHSTQAQFGDESKYSTFSDAPILDYAATKLLAEKKYPSQTTPDNAARGELASLGLGDLSGKANSDKPESGKKAVSHASVNVNMQCSINAWSRFAILHKPMSLLDIWKAQDDYARISHIRRANLANKRNVLTKMSKQSISDVVDPYPNATILFPLISEFPYSNMMHASAKQFVVDPSSSLASIKGGEYNISPGEGGFFVKLGLDECKADGFGFATCSSEHSFEAITLGHAGGGIMEFFYRTRYDLNLENAHPKSKRKTVESERNQMILGLHMEDYILHDSLDEDPKELVWDATVKRLQNMLYHGKLNSAMYTNVIHSSALIIDIDSNKLSKKLVQLGVNDTGEHLEVHPLSKLHLPSHSVEYPVAIETAISIDSEICRGVIGARPARFSPSPPAQFRSFYSATKNREVESHHDRPTKDSELNQSNSFNMLIDSDLYSPLEPTGGDPNEAPPILESLNLELPKEETIAENKDRVNPENRRKEANILNKPKYRSPEGVSHAWFSAPLAFIQDQLCELPSSASSALGKKISQHVRRSFSYNSQSQSGIETIINAEVTPGGAIEISKQSESFLPFMDRIIALPRGGCTFPTKVRNAVQLGAAGVIIVNNEPNQMSVSMGGTRMWTEQEAAEFVIKNAIKMVTENTAGTDQDLDESISWSKKLFRSFQAPQISDVLGDFPIPAYMISKEAGDWLSSCAAEAEKVARSTSDKVRKHVASSKILNISIEETKGNSRVDEAVNAIQHRENSSRSPLSDGLLDVAMTAASYKVTNYDGMPCNLANSANLDSFYKGQGNHTREKLDNNSFKIAQMSERKHINEVITPLNQSPLQDVDGFCFANPDWLPWINGGELRLNNQKSLIFSTYNDHIGILHRIGQELTISVKKRVDVFPQLL